MQDKVVAEAVRLEFEEKTGDLYIVFKIKDEQYKQEIKKTWAEDIEYRIVDKYLVKNE